MCVVLEYFLEISVSLITPVLTYSGPWAKKFMEPLGLDLPLRTVRNESLYWGADVLLNNGRKNFKMIIISDGSADTDGAYIIPEYEYPGLLKVNLLHV